MANGPFSAAGLRLTVTTIAEQIDQAVAAHAAWKMRLERTTLSGALDLDPDAMADDGQCRFGHWLLGPMLGAADRAHPRFGAVVALHHEFHHLAGEVLARAEAGERDAVRALLNEDFLDCSDRLLAALAGWKDALAR
jgi:hypothetical protein